MSSHKRKGATSFKKGNNMLMKVMDNAKGQQCDVGISSTSASLTPESSSILTGASLRSIPLYNICALFLSYNHHIRAQILVNFRNEHVL